MDCASCGRSNRAGARFCGGCGRPLAPRCPACGSESAADAQFCDACGASLVAISTEDGGGARKVVTIVFADLIGSTALHERLDAESTRLFMDRYYAAMRGAVEAEGGSVTQLLGDGVKAVFGAPRVAEDDAIRAVRGAVGMQRAFRELAREQSEAVGRVGLRVAVNTGEVVADDKTEIIGDPVNVAARLQQEAHDGDVLIGESTRRLVSARVTLAPFGTFALKGRSEAVAAWRVVSLDRPGARPATAFVGRGDELRRITAVYEAAVSARSARLAVILGSPGLGKSRLIDELGRRLGDGATLLSARCDAHGGATFAPLARAFRALLHVDDGIGSDALRAGVEAFLPVDDSERSRIAAGVAALVAGTPAPPEESFFVVRRFLAALALTRPVVFSIDDLHWAEPLLLDLTEHLVQWSTGVPLLILAAARPELRDVRASLAAPGGVVSDVVTLSGLDAGAATRLAANLIGADALPAAVAGRVLAISEGNPLFLGELVRMLVDDGALKREGDRWVTGVELAELEMPPTIHALLAARIERLRPEERSVLERAAVVGRHFSRAAVAELLPPELRSELDARLEALRRSDLIEPDTGWLLGEPVLRFHHVLIRDAAYRRLLKGTRAELHARFGDWLEARVGDAVEHDEMLGWHLEQAHQHLRELGPIDERGRGFGQRAARHLAAAGRRALARDDLPLAAGLLGRAQARLDADDPARADLALDCCEALLAAGNVGPAAAAVAELGRFSSASDRLHAWHTCFAGQLAVLTDPQALRATADAVAAAAEQLTSAGDAAGEAKAHSVHALALARLGKIGACEAALDRALAAARRVSDRRRQNAVLAGAPLAALWGPSPVTRASGRCLDVVRVLRITQGAPAVEAIALCCQGVLEALRGRSDAARRMIASSRRLVEELGITQRLLEADVFAGSIELLEGDAVAAERCLRGAYHGLRDHGLGIDAAQAAALLGRALLAQGRAAEAEALSHESEALAGDDLKAAITWRGVRAEALAQRGEHAAAIEFARAAVELAAATDNLLDHADARTALAAALRAAGRSVEAGAEEARATLLWEAKGATLLTERARRGAAGAAEADRASAERALSRPIHRRVRANAATESAARVDAAIVSRDIDALDTLSADDAEIVHHPTGVVYDQRGSLAAYRSLFRAEDVTYRHEPLASLGDSLALCRSSWSFAALAGDDFAPFGAVEREEIFLCEVDTRGQRRRTEFFATDRLGDAVARLYERYAELLPDGAERVGAAATARTVAALLGAFDLGRYAPALAPTVEFVDHRFIGMESTHGADAYLRLIGTLLEIADDIATRVDDVVGLRSDALLVRWMNFGTERAGGGAYERQFLRLWVFGADGLLTRCEFFDTDRAAEALARFDELAAEPPAHARMENAATRSWGRFRDGWQAREWERVAALFAPGFRHIDRRTLVRLETDRDAYLESMRAIWGMSSSRFTSDVLATRGERLVLSRARFEGADRAIGRSEIDWLEVTEVDEGGDRVAMIMFDPDALDAAYAELDARYAAGEAAACAHVSAAMRAFNRAFASRDWDALAAQCAPDLVVNDHRLLGWETLRGPEAYVRALRSLVDLAPDAKLRLDHVAMCGSGYLVITVWVGTREGGAFEAPSLMVSELDGQARIRRFDQYDLERQGEARARFEALRPDSPRIPSNAATRARDQAGETFAARDWVALRSLTSDDFQFEDRRKRALLSGDVELWVSALQLLALAVARLEGEPIGTCGERISLERVTFAGALAGVRFETDEIRLIEVDASGQLRACILFDVEDRCAAFAEAQARFVAGEAASVGGQAPIAQFSRALWRRDLRAMRATMAEHLRVNDQRSAGMGLLEGRSAYLESLRAVRDLAPDVNAESLRILVWNDHGRVSVLRTFGTVRDGGPFEYFYVGTHVTEAGVIQRIELFDLDDTDQALARFAELCADRP